MAAQAEVGGGELRTGAFSFEAQKENQKRLHRDLPCCGLQQVTVTQSTVPGLADALHRPGGAKHRLKSE